MSTAPLLTIPIRDGEFIVDTDGSNFGLGAVLTQVQNSVERPIAFASWSLSPTEKSYCATRKELLAVVYALKQFRQYVLDRPFVIRVDHSSLQRLSSPSLSSLNTGLGKDPGIATSMPML